MTVRTLQNYNQTVLIKAIKGIQTRLALVMMVVKKIFFIVGSLRAC